MAVHPYCLPFVRFFFLPRFLLYWQNFTSLLCLPLNIIIRCTIIKDFVVILIQNGVCAMQVAYYFKCFIWNDFSKHYHLTKITVYRVRFECYAYFCTQTKQKIKRFVEHSTQKTEWFKLTNKMHRCMQNEQFHEHIIITMITKTFDLKMSLTNV